MLRKSNTENLKSLSKLLVKHITTSKICYNYTEKITNSVSTTFVKPGTTVDWTIYIQLTVLHNWSVKCSVTYIIGHE